MGVGCREYDDLGCYKVRMMQLSTCVGSTADDQNIMAVTSVCKG